MFGVSFPLLCLMMMMKRDPFFSTDWLEPREREKKENMEIERRSAAHERL